MESATNSSIYSNSALMQIKVITTESEFLAIKDCWQQLTNEPLRSWSWNYNWWKHLGQDYQLCLIKAVVDDRMVGIAPFVIETRQGESCLRYIGSGRTCTDYAQLIVDEDYTEEFCEAIAGEVNRKDGPLSSVSLVELEGISADVNSNTLKDSLHGQFWNYQRDLESTWVVDLPDNWDEFVKGRCKSLRRKIRKQMKRYDAGEAVALSTENGLELESAFETLVQLHQERFEAKGEPGCFADKRFYNFLKQAVIDLHAKDQAHIVQCKFHDQVVATHIYLRTESGIQMYQTGIRVESMKDEPGHMILTFVVQDAIARGFKTLDFLRGNERYKRNWGGKPTPLYKVRCVSNRMTSTLKHQAIVNARRCRDWIRDSYRQMNNKSATATK